MRKPGNKIFTIILCAIGFLLSSLSLNAQDKSVSVFKQSYAQLTAQGISSQTTYTLLHDKNGFIWVSTRNGIDRYDGISFRHYKLGTSQIRTMRSGMSITIYCDDKGDIWAFTERSDIYRFNPLTDSFELELYLPDFQIWGSVQALYCQGDLLVLGATDGITCYDIPTKTIVKRLCPDEDVRTFLSYRESEIFFGSSRGVGILDLRELHASTHHWTNSDVKTLYYDNANQRLWIGCNGNGLFLLNPTQAQSAQHIDQTNGFIVTDIEPFNDKEVLISVDGGGVKVCSFDQDASQMTLSNLASDSNDAPYSLRSSGVRSLLVDEGNIWIASYMGGVVQLHPVSSLTFLNASQIQAPSDNYAFGVDVGLDGRLWVAFNQSIGSFAPDGSDAKMYLDREARFLTVRAASDGTIWCGGFNTGTYHFDPRTGEKTHYPTVVDQPVLDCVYEIFEDLAGDIWLGGLNFQLTRLHQLPDKTYEKTHYPITLVNSIAQLNADTLVVSTTDGFHLVNIHTNEDTSLLREEEIWSGTNYICDARTRLGKEIWIATAGAGLVCYDVHTNQIESYNLDNGLPSLELRGMSMIGDSILYISTEDNGLFAFDCNRRCYLRCLMTSDGLPMNEFLQNSATSTPNGGLLFGGDNGVVVLTADDMHGYLRDFSIFVDAKDLKDNELKIESQTRSIDLQLTTNDIYHQKDYLFFYRMEGVEDQWVPVDETRHIRFSHLPAGFYELEIRAVGAANQVSNRTIKIEIEASSFWAANIIAISYVFLFISLICLFFSARLYLKNRKFMKG